MPPVALLLARSIEVYLALGVLFAVAFAWRGAGRLDPAAAHASWGFRLIVVPAAALLWPLLAWRWLAGRSAPPLESNAHRRAAGRGR